jgi:energy-coupling factor transporter ATP-binding protein EcfA2
MTVENNNQITNQAGIYKATGDQRPRQEGGAGKATSGFAALNGYTETEGGFEAKVVVHDENTVVVEIKRVDDKNAPVVQLRFSIAEVNKGAYRAELIYYLIEGNNARQLWTVAWPFTKEVLSKIRSLLHTNKQGLPDDGKIAGIIGEIIALMEREAKERSKEYKARIAHELYERALKEPGLSDDPLRYVIDTVQLLHAGDEKAIIIVFLIVLTSRLPEQYRLNVLILAPSGKGKTDLLKLISRLIPKKWKYSDVMIGATPKSFIYEALERRGFVVDLRGKVIIINEPSWLTQNSETEESGFKVIKQLFYDLSDAHAIPYRTTVKDERGRIRSVELKVLGRPVLVATAEDKDVPSIPTNMFTRFFPVWLDTSLQSLALSGMKIREKMSNSSLFREFDRRAKLVRAFLLRKYPRIDDVVITEDAGKAIIDCPSPGNPMLCNGYAGELLNPEARAVFNRATSYLFALSAAHAYLRRKWREDNGRRILVVTKQDVDEVWALVGDVIKALARGKESKTEALMMKIREIFMEHGPNAILTPSDVHKELSSTGEVIDPAYVRRLLSMMVETGLLERCRWGKYALKCPEADVTKYLNEEGKEDGGKGG